MTIKIKMFTKTVCPTCRIAKSQLSFLPVPVEIEEVNIETDTLEVNGVTITAHDYLIMNLESMATPTFLFESGRVIRGYNEGELREELGL